MSIELPESHRFLAGDYMRENPMYSAREVRELIAAEREACAELLERQHTWISAVAAAKLVRERSNARGEPGGTNHSGANGA